MSERTIVYRFFPWDTGLLTLEQGRLKLGRFSEFNDPFETMPQKPAYSGDKGIVWEFHEREFLRALDSHFGVVSFSGPETIKKPLMWSHYAGSHGGMAIGFELHHPTNRHFLTKSSGEVYDFAVTPVSYLGFQPSESDKPVSNLRPLVRGLETIVEAGTANLTGNMVDAVFEEAAFNLMTHKGVDWEYEDEWRLICGRGKTVFENGHYFLPLDDATIADIVLGFRFPPHLSLGLEHLARRYDARLFRAVPNRTHYALDIEEIDLGVGLPPERASRTSPPPLSP